MRFKKILLKALIVSFFVFAAIQIQPLQPVLLSNEQDDRLQKLTEEIEQYEQEINKLKSQANTLSNQIAQFDAQIKLTILKITETEEKILLLGGRIDQLEISLNSLSTAFSTRAVKTYKMSKVHEPMLLLINSPDISDAINSYYYLQKIQEADRELLVRLEEAQEVYMEEKVDQEVLQQELEEHKSVLGAQKSAKASLLEQTRNDEKKYQQLLSQARAEFEAIQAIIAGQGEETEVGKVSQGDTIASIIEGASCNSSGGHLHFIVREGKSAQNPFNHLKGGVDFENCSGGSCGSGDGDPFNPSGSWDWPINPKIKFTQGYGSTWAVKNTWVGRIYSFHNGIDVDSESSSAVKAVQPGMLYHGSYTGYNGCRLRYVRVDHDNSELDTLYLHINY
jgi:septal ring factor EnvC (AmiA/AmiB activator)